MAVNREKIEQKLKKFSKECSVAFAYRCALRVLPLLALRGNFDYWQDHRDEYLFAVFHTFDATELFLFGEKFDAAYATVAKATAAADGVAYAAARATAATYNLARATTADTFYVTDAAYAAASARAAATVEKNVISSGFIRVLEETINEDLAILSKFNENEKVFLHLLQQPLWNQIPFAWSRLVQQFQQALQADGFGFWGSIFEQRFRGKTLDLTFLQQRMELPPEIREQGQAVMVRYWESLYKEGARYLKEIKVVFLGDGGTGKTSLVKKILDRRASLAEEEIPTPGVDIHQWQSNNEEIQAHLWDFGGRSSCMLLIVFSCPSVPFM